MDVINLFIYNNTIEEGLVIFPEEYIYGSAKDYRGEKGTLEDVIVVM